MTKPFLPPYESETEGQLPRDKDRDSLFLQADVRIPGKCNATRVRIRNLSAGGLMAEAPVDVERGDVVHVDLRNVGDVSGKVAWTAEGRFGVAFDHPIDPKQVRKPVGSADTRPNFIRKLDIMGRPIGPKSY
ncbi:PilZ domain-containing protein [Novosphingopyxis sp. YJ-S2-01]|uniref:PilZ domain-containing protein n=1 Tax=Novosphingopyxis sp. YJ-S2-01 TaxID=2794021 RepID=UPI0018DCD045|nr:PilZ domain-containing protein [Novosphingopyxis sp. YJ-S2-01]MBH9538817.1 PilZ domain-containing protein [Novosphingopyxis sp. YJ-S2-01]